MPPIPDGRGPDARYPRGARASALCRVRLRRSCGLIAEACYPGADPGAIAWDAVSDIRPCLADNARVLRAALSVDASRTGVLRLALPGDASCTGRPGVRAAGTDAPDPWATRAATLAQHPGAVHLVAVTVRVAEARDPGQGPGAVALHAVTKNPSRLADNARVLQAALPIDANRIAVPINADTGGQSGRGLLLSFPARRRPC